MFKDNIQISIITLTKNDINKFIKTLHSINNQTQKVEIEWLIIDGSTNSQDIDLIISWCSLLKLNFLFLTRGVWFFWKKCGNACKVGY